MSYAAYKMMHWPTGIENCATGFVTHCLTDFTPQIPFNQTDDLESEWPSRRGIGHVPNLIVTAAKILEIYAVRVQEVGNREARNSTEVKRGGIMDGVILKICQIPSASNYDNYWPVQKVHKPVNQVVSSLVDQEVGHQMDNHNLSPDELHRTYTADEFEVRILEPQKSGGPWETKATIPMQSSENALTVRVVTLFNTTTKENESLLAIGTADVQGEDVATRRRVLLFSIGRNTDNPQNLVSKVYSKELKGAISALVSLQGHLLIASGPKIILHKWTGNELNGIAFYDAPPLYVVSLNIASVTYLQYLYDML
ncbi:hypothetical protein CRYUN_Cryun07bG0092000 [Craigia yunnanensis]